MEAGTRDGLLPRRPPSRRRGGLAIHGFGGDGLSLPASAREAAARWASTRAAAGARAATLDFCRHRGPPLFFSFLLLFSHLLSLPLIQATMGAALGILSGATRHRPSPCFRPALLRSLLPHPFQPLPPAAVSPSRCTSCAAGKHTPALTSAAGSCGSCVASVSSPGPRSTVSA